MAGDNKIDKEEIDPKKWGYGEGKRGDDEEKPRGGGSGEKRGGLIPAGTRPDPETGRASGPKPNR